MQRKATGRDETKANGLHKKSDKQSHKKPQKGEIKDIYKYRAGQK